MQNKCRRNAVEVVEEDEVAEKLNLLLIINPRDVLF
jgi:hypothetical protein